MKNMESIIDVFITGKIGNGQKDIDPNAGVALSVVTDLGNDNKTFITGTMTDIIIEHKDAEGNPPAVYLSNAKLADIKDELVDFNEDAMTAYNTENMFNFNNIRRIINEQLEAGNIVKGSQFYILIVTKDSNGGLHILNDEISEITHIKYMEEDAPMICFRSDLNTAATNITDVPEEEPVEIVTGDVVDTAGINAIPIEEVE